MVTEVTVIQSQKLHYDTALLTKLLKSSSAEYIKRLHFYTQGRLYFMTEFLIPLVI